MRLSIIIPAKNEESNLPRCLESLDSCLKGVPDKEIIVVDSFSQDNTTEIASKFNVKILRLKPDWLHSPSAGRYIGTLFASGEFILFIDADMTLEPGFAEKALLLLEKDRLIAGVSGWGEEIYLRNNHFTGEKNNFYRIKKPDAPVNFLGGCALYRKESLVKAGGFNPYLSAGEEIELAQRLRALGYKLFSISSPMITHFTAPLEDWQEFTRKKGSRLFLGIGQSLRISHSLSFLIESLVYYKGFMVFAGFIFLAIILFMLAAITGKFIYLSLIPLALLALFIFTLSKKRNIKKALISLLKWAIISSEIIRGIALKPKNPANYPTDPDILKGTFDVQR